MHQWGLLGARTGEAPRMLLEETGTKDASLSQGPPSTRREHASPTGAVIGWPGSGGGRLLGGDWQIT